MEGVSAGLREAARAPRLTLAQFTRRVCEGHAAGRYAGEVKRVPITDGPAPRMRWAADALRHATIEWICRGGGFRVMMAPVGESQAKSKRLWESPVWEGLDLRFSSLSLTWLVEAYELGSAQTGGEPRELRLSGDEAASLGDELVLELLLNALLGDDEAWRGFLALTPNKDGPAPRARLSRLLRPDLGAPSQAEVEALQAGGYSVLWCYLDRLLAKSWLAREEALERPAAQVARGGYEALGRTLGAWARAAQRSERPHLLLPVAEYFARRLRQAGSREGLVRGVQERVVRDIESASERQAFLASMGEIYKVGAILEAAAQEVVRRVFIERSASDKRFLAGYHDIFAPVAEDVRIIGRRFSGEIG